MKRVALLVLVLVAGCGGSSPPPKPAAAPVSTPAVVDAPCRPPRVHRTRYPGGDERLYSLPWISGKPRELGLVGLLWYWPKEWRDVRRAQVFIGDVGPDGQSAKILWAFLEPDVYDRAEGAPSWASNLDLPTPGCWRLWLSSGELRAFVDIRAVSMAP